MTNDPTEAARRLMTETINAANAERATLEALHGQVWNTTQLNDDFTVHSFLAPYVVATRHADGVRGTLMFQHHPRFYFAWKPD